MELRKNFENKKDKNTHLKLEGNTEIFKKDASYM